MSSSKLAKDRERKTKKLALNKETLKDLRLTKGGGLHGGAINDALTTGLAVRAATGVTSAR